MAIIKPFQAVRPLSGYASYIASPPYDVYNRESARTWALRNPLSFLNIDRPETQFPPDWDMYAPTVYQKAAALYEEMKAKGYYIKDDALCMYIYEQSLEGRCQTGLVACVRVDDYLKQRIRRHENTLEVKERDRIRHINALNAQTGPVFLTYRSEPEITEIICRLTKNQPPVYDFTGEDHVGHRVWKIADTTMIGRLSRCFLNVPAMYIADGHHRALAAVKVCLERRAACPGYTGMERFNYFLAALFPVQELRIYGYHRVVSDLNGWCFGDFLNEVKKRFHIQPVKADGIVRPSDQGQLIMYHSFRWYKLKWKVCHNFKHLTDGLDVSVLQNEVLAPLLNIQDPKNDPRLSFCGGINAAEMVKEKVDQQGGVGFILYPTSIEEMLAVSDSGGMMPPKSTWFEPKLRSGLFIYEL